MFLIQVLPIVWLRLELFRMGLTVPYPAVLVFMVKPFLPRTIYPIRIWAILICAVIRL
jgi:hypothetical protein